MWALMRSPPWAVVLAAFLVSSCSDDLTTTAPTDDPDVILSMVSGDEQAWFAGYELPDALVVKVTKRSKAKTDCGWRHSEHHCSEGVPGYLVNFRVIEGGGNVFAGAAHSMTTLGE